MKLEYFYYVKILSECSSINMAANRLLLTQPYLSAILSRVEQELGIQIFERTNRGIVLTPAGQELLKLIDDLEQIMVQINALRFTAGTQKYRICSFSALFISNIANHYDKIQLLPMLSRQAEDQMFLKRCDLYRTYHPQSGQPLPDVQARNPPFLKRSHIFHYFSPVPAGRKDSTPF